MLLEFICVSTVTAISGGVRLLYSDLQLQLSNSIRTISNTIDRYTFNTANCLIGREGGYG